MKQVILKKSKRSAKFNVLFPANVPLIFSPDLKSVEHPKHKNIWIVVKPSEVMELVKDNVELNEDFLPNQNLTYDVFYDGKRKFIAILNERNAQAGVVGHEDAPKILEYKMQKDLAKFDSDERAEILSYSGLKEKTDGFEAGDVFMEKSYIRLQTKVDGRCYKYPDSAALPDEDDNCSMCGGNCVE